MTDMVTIACTLDGDNLKKRVDWISELNLRALLGLRRDGSSLVLYYSPEAIGEVRKLVAEEQACCAFLDFRLDEGADRITLVITAPEEAGTAIGALFEPFVAGVEPPRSSNTCGCSSACGA